MTDQMTPIERKNALKSGKSVDRLPIALFHPEFAAKYAGLSYFESHYSPEKLAHREVNMYRSFGLDEIALMYVKLPKTSSNLIQKLEEIHKLDLDDYTLDKDHRQQVNREALDRIYSEVGQEAVISYGLSGPLTLAQGILPTKTLMKGLIKTPDLVHDFLQFCTDFLKYLTDSLSDYPFLQYFIYDPVASGSLISAKTYEKFCLPYTKQLIDHMRDQTDTINLHICGNTSDRLDLFVQTGIDGFSLDQEVDLAFAKETIGDSVTLQGNVDPVATLLLGEPEGVEREVKICFEKAQDSPKGFVLRSGCGVPYRVPSENIEAFVKAGKKYGARAAEAL